MNDKNKQQGKQGYEMQDFQGKYGGSVDGWWAPEEESTIKGILVNWIDKNRSDQLQSDSIILELIDDCTQVKNGGSDRIEGEKKDGKLYTAPKGCLIGVPVWKQLEGLWPRKAGFVVHITHPGSEAGRAIGKGRTMYDLKIQTSNKAVKHVEVYEETPDAPVAPEGEFQVG